MRLKSWIAERIPPGWRYPVSRAYRWTWRSFAYARAWCTGQGWPRGHFYSPLANLAEVRARADKLFSKDADLGPSIDLRSREQLALVEKLAEYYGEFDWPDRPAPGRSYYLNNDFFRFGDAVVLYGLLRHLRPARVIEVGSGFTSALMLDTRDRFLDYRPQLTFIEPYSARVEMLLGAGDREGCRVIRRMVQDVPPGEFAALSAGDVLFVDSSHVSKAGSDLNHLVFEVLPALNSGVIVHFHDVYWPFEYPRRWIESFRWSWNEAYLLRAFLQYNRSFEILLFNSYAEHAFGDFLRQRMPRVLDEPGASLWLRKA